MSEENTTIYSAVTDAPHYRLVPVGDKTFIVDAVTGKRVFYVVGSIGGGGVTVMTTEERLASTPAAGALIYDSDDENLYVGDGVTAGGIPVSNAELESRVDNLEEAVQIIESGGEIMMGSYICGDWTDYDDGDVVEFADWTA